MEFSKNLSFSQFFAQLTNTEQENDDDDDDDYDDDDDDDAINDDDDNFDVHDHWNEYDGSTNDDVDPFCSLDVFAASFSFIPFEEADSNSMRHQIPARKLVSLSIGRS